MANHLEEKEREFLVRHPEFAGLTGILAAIGCVNGRAPEPENPYFYMYQHMLADGGCGMCLLLFRKKTKDLSVPESIVGRYRLVPPPFANWHALLPTGCR
jgi:hypothetical protein